MSDRILGLDAGADDYLVKPFAVEELLARMRALSRRSKNTTAADALVVANLHLSTLRHTVHVLGQRIDLTTREFALLEYFMENAAIVLTRDMILERVWGWGFGGSGNIVDVYVRYLRQKVPWTMAGARISTVRGMGYTLQPVDDP
jgi:DNA-binding response OmpR family regulator